MLRYFSAKFGYNELATNNVTESFHFNNIHSLYNEFKLNK